MSCYRTAVPTLRQALEAARRVLPPEGFAQVERTVKAYPKSEARYVAQVVVPPSRGTSPA